MSARSIEAFSIRSILLVLVANCCLLAQNQVSQAREFEAVSVKPMFRRAPHLSEQGSKRTRRSSGSIIFPSER
jgi:hypothetical protein